ncbi:aminotransferase class III-fold pyridoxal phosphate-dependent enzyme [Enhygromyxa salina]|uniref:aminotransferase class III-fold pyridoxal phosphate-dependent enzyme n=1 Tax=Enhygromyxa salina TaxID=215803 RepID=UPI0015E633D2|nr:aminotransferase class III-fold pyridoxal phosphate-dependent enzyme [Enhygromyxa salina]
MPPRPQLDASRIAALAYQLWDLAASEGGLQDLGSYDDCNYLITSRSLAGEHQHVIKVSVEPREIIELQVAVLRHLAARPSADLVPRVIPSRSGDALVSITDATGQPCIMRVLSFIPGQLWSALPAPTPALRRALGLALAQLDRDLEDFEHPAMYRSTPWNLTEADWIADELGPIEAGPRRALIVDALAQFRARVIPRVPDLSCQLIHGDANDNNLVVASDELRGIFDFGDVCVAPTICDLAIALAYAGMVPDPIQALAEVCVGYHERRPLTPLELDLLFDLIRARLAVSVTSSTLARAREPDNEHSFSSEAQAWSLLGKLTEFGRRAVTKYLASACGLPAPVRVPGARSRPRLLAQRRVRLGASLSLAYDSPLYIRRGEGTWLFDEHDNAYLDCVNNISHVGHCHPRVVAAAAQQLATLNTNTRYLHEGILNYAESLCATLPAPLSVVFLVCSGTEANELALRIARAHTGANEVVVVGGAYHGNSSTLVDISPYKFDGPGGRGRPAWVHVLDTPDPRRGRHADDGPAYAQGIAVADQHARARGERLAAFICESVLGCAGQIVPATGFLAAAYEQARAAGAVCIADEVQVGFGRVGDAMWAFQAEGVVPDILTLGKPIANGHPVGAVVTTPALAASFASGMEYFNSFGGNPVSCAVAQAVLDVIREEGLIDNARETGAWLQAELEQLGDPGVAQVRGRGLFLGIELVEPGAERPDAARAKALVEHAHNRGVLLSVDGPAHNVVKIKPPMCFELIEAQILVATVAAGLAATRR